MNIRVVNKGKHELPRYQTKGSVGVDVRANIESPITLGPLDRVVVPTGLFVSIPEGYEINVRPRSGLAAQYGVTVLNSPGTIDSDYRGEVGVILINHSREPFVISDGDRIAQLVVAKFERISFFEVGELGDTERGDGAFGHTGR